MLTRPELKFSDTSDERLFYKRLGTLPPKEGPHVVRLVDHKDYFSALAEDADLVADEIYKTTSVIKTHGGVRYVTMLPAVFALFMRHCLVVQALKVEVYSKQFQLLVLATPGSLERLAETYGVDLELHLADGSSPVVAAIKVASGPARRVGVCLVDLLAHTIRVADFDDNELFSNLELLCVQLSVREVVLPQLLVGDPAAPDTARLLQVLARLGNVVVATAKPALFAAADVPSDLAKIVAHDAAAPNAIDLALAAKGISTAECALSLGACGALVHHLDLLAAAEASFSIDKHAIGAYMRLDAATTRALNVFPAPAAGPAPTVAGAAPTSVYALLNKCKSAAGSRTLSQWLKQPLTDKARIEERHLLVQHFVSDTSLRVFVAEWLAGVPDVKRLLKKIAAGVAKPAGAENKKLDDVVLLYQLVCTLPALLDMLETCQGSDATTALVRREWTDPIAAHHTALLKYVELVDTTIDLTPLELRSVHVDFNIKPEFDESLVAINAALQDTSVKITEIHHAVAADLSIDIDKKLKLERHQVHGWCFRVTRIDLAILRNTGDRYIELQTVKSGVFFTTKKLRALSQNYASLSDEYNAKQRELIREILLITTTYHSVFTKLALALSTLDVLSAFAHVALFAPTPFVKPVVHALAESCDSPEFASRKLVLPNARHPVLEVQEDMSFVPNDVNLSNDENVFAIITGPNMGGKSTYIRQIGVIALMSQAGSFVPAGDDGAVPEIPVFDAILSRVGAGDSQLKGLSTFMIEMLETSLILASATHNSLVIIDELGRGTSTYDGFGLAWAISENILSVKRCVTLFATHFHELTKLAEKYPGKVLNMHVVAQVEGTANEDDITLMYRVEPGISDKSFGIHVAELVKFPAKIVNMAKRKAAELSLDSDSSAKRSKCTEDEIAKGVSDLKQILKKWRASCVGPDGNCKVLSEEAVSILKSTAGNTSDKFIQELFERL